MPSDRVILVDVAPRDGLQTLPEVWSVADRVALGQALFAAGLKRVELASFVNPARVPQMGEAEAVIAGVSATSGRAALALNARGVTRALATDVDEIRVAIVASDTFSQRNQGMTTEASLAQFRDLAPTVRASGTRLTAVIAAAFGCPFEGEVDPGRVADIARTVLEAGADEVGLADTIGCGVPAQVRDLAARIAPDLGGRPLGLHLHNTRATGYANAFTGLEHGVSVLDAATGGIGGCPFAPGATGNIATEDLVWMLERSGIATGIDLDALMRLSESLKARAGAAHSGTLLKAGRFPQIARRTAA
jgi:hydroxymethylglutaryl-CoA lyase